MLPGKAKIVKCPYCGKEKELMTLLSGNTCGAEYWSDNKRIAPMLPSVSPVQKCPKCGKYYFEYKQSYTEGKNCSFEQGKLNFPEWKEAYKQFLSENVDTKDMLNVYIEIIHSYNDCFYRNHSSQKSTEEDYEFFVKMVLEFIDHYEWNQDELLFKAELYREAGKMKECSDVLGVISYDNLQDFTREIYTQIKHRMENNDSKVFRL
jgi:endogenous inhibitor of DNA gyrase (YacG/DUF329 family)